MNDVELHQGDCLDVLPTLPAASFDLVLTDPPYPCIKRSYGTWTEAEWWALMRAVVPECMRVLKPTGSAVFVLQPNSERVGRMRTWLWDFLAWVGREWGIVQDAWWWRPDAPPGGGEGNRRGLLRPSLKACVWVGSPDCWRDRRAVLLSPSERQLARARQYAEVARCGEKKSPSGLGMDSARVASAARQAGGSTPFNVIKATHGAGQVLGAARVHGARTPLTLCSWWTHYLCPPAGRVLDPFCGSGTAGLAALNHGASFVGIERVPEYVEIARERIAAARKVVPA